MSNEQNNSKKEVTFRQALLVILIILVTILVCAMMLKSNVVTTFFITAVELLVISLVLKFSYDESKSRSLIAQLCDPPEAQSSTQGFKPMLKTSLFCTFLS